MGPKGRKISEHPPLHKRVGGIDETANAIAALAFAFAHPLRVRIINALEERPNSAIRLSKQFGDVNNGDCSHHLKVLERVGLVYRYKQRPVRGSTEYFFRLVPREKWANLWPKISSPALGTLRSAQLRLLVNCVLDGASSPTLDDFEQTVSASRRLVDRQGFNEIRDAVEGALAVIDRAVSESHERLQKTDSPEEINAITALAAFAIAGPDPFLEGD